MIPQGKGWREGQKGWRGWEVQVSGYGMNKSRKWKVQHKEYVSGTEIALYGNIVANMWWTQHNQ